MPRAPRMPRIGDDRPTPRKPTLEAAQPSERQTPKRKGRLTAAEAGGIEAGAPSPAMKQAIKGKG